MLDLIARLVDAGASKAAEWFPQLFGELEGLASTAGEWLSKHYAAILAGVLGVSFLIALLYDGEQLRKAGKQTTERPKPRAKDAVICPRCGLEQSEERDTCAGCGYQFRVSNSVCCPRCGLKQNKARIVCARCHYQLLEIETVFCPRCGLRQPKDNTVCAGCFLSLSDISWD